jgi:hypothetical protein
LTTTIYSKEATMKDVIFIEFISQDGRHGNHKYYFVGASTYAIMKDAVNFGYEKFSHREIPEDEARSLNLGFLDEGIASIKDGSSDSFRLRTPL